MTLVKKEEITQLIPQRPPILMVDALLEHSQDMTVSSFEIKEDNMFCDGKVFTEPGLIENIAQTAALRAGYVSRQNQMSEPPLGFIGAVSKLKISALPEAGQKIRTEIKIKHEVFGVTLVSGKSSCEGKTLAECEMKIVLVNES